MKTKPFSINDYGGIEITKADGTRVPTSRDMALSRGITRCSCAVKRGAETGEMIFHYSSADDEIPELFYRFPFSVSLLEQYQSGEDFIINQLVTTPNLYHTAWYHPIYGVQTPLPIPQRGQGFGSGIKRPNRPQK